MAQLSIFDKQKHFSKKDFTCSIGKYDIVYMTFRHYSWRRFTHSESIQIRVEGDVLKFDDPETSTHGGGVFALRKAREGYPSTIDSTRYIQLDGKAWPAIRRVIQRTAGSYDIPKTTEPDEETREKMEANKIALDDFTRLCMKKHGRVKDAPTSEELAEAHRPDLAKLAEVFKTEKPVIKTDDEKTLRDQFLEDARTLCETATSTEERTAIYNALAVVYRLRYEQDNPTETPVKIHYSSELGGDPNNWAIP